MLSTYYRCPDSNLFAADVVRAGTTPRPMTGPRHLRAKIWDPPEPIQEVIPPDTGSDGAESAGAVMLESCTQIQEVGNGHENQQGRRVESGGSGEFGVVRRGSGYLSQPPRRHSHLHRQVE